MHSNAAKCRPLLPHDARGWGGQYWRLTSFPNIRRWRWHCPIASSPRRLHLQIPHSETNTSPSEQSFLLPWPVRRVKGLPASSRVLRQQLNKLQG